MYEIYTKLLQEKGVKTSDVCRATGIVASTFSDWKKGKSAPKQDKLKKIADYFEVSLEYLMTGKEPEVDFEIYKDENAVLLAEASKSSSLMHILEYASKLSPEMQKVLEVQAKALSEENKKE